MSTPKVGGKIAPAWITLDRRFRQEKWPDQFFETFQKVVEGEPEGAEDSDENAAEDSEKKSWIKRLVS